MLVVDLDPAKRLTLTLSGTNVEAIQNAVDPKNLIVGAGHAPALESWLPDVSGLTFMGSTTYTDLATQYLFDENDLYDRVFSCGVSTWAEWTVFVVGQTNVVPAVESTFFVMSQRQPSAWPGSGIPADIPPLISIVAGPTNFVASVFNNNLSSGAPIVLGAVDTTAHVFELSANGAGGIDAFIDGVHTSGTDYRPKSINNMTLGALWYLDPRFVLEQLNGSIARVFIFDKNLSTSERLRVRTQLGALYGVPL